MKSSALVSSTQTLWVAIAGFVLGAAIACRDLLPEVFTRLGWALSGGTGESAIWGEPLFYAVIIGVPAGLLGAAGSIALFWVVRWIGRGRKG